MRAAVGAVVFVFVANLLYGQTGCTIVPDQGTAGAPIQFSGCGSDVLWSFGDGIQASGNAVTHSYAVAGVFNWSVQSGGTQIDSGRITIVDLPGGQCPVCPIDPPTAGDTSKVSAFGLCPDLSSFTLSFGNGSTQKWPMPNSSQPYCAPSIRNPACYPVGTLYSTPGVYAWSVSMTRDGQTCQRTGHITIIGCKVTKLITDAADARVGSSIKLNWGTNGSIDCHPGGDVKTVSFEIDLDNYEIDSVPDNIFSRTIETPLGSPFYLGYHVLGVKPIICRSCSPCGGACALAGPGYYPADNEQPVTILSDPNCSRITLTVEPKNQTYNGSSNITLTASSSSAPARFDWCQTAGPNTHFAWCDSSNISSGLSTYNPPYPVSGFYWVTATSPCGRWARSSLVAVCTPPRITKQPQGSIIGAGQSAALVVEALGTQLTFQWYALNPASYTPLSGAVSGEISPYFSGVAYATTTFRTPPLTGKQAYFVEARDICGNVVASEVATVAIGKRRSVRH